MALSNLAAGSQPCSLHPKLRTSFASQEVEVPQNLLDASVLCLHLTYELLSILPFLVDP